MGAIRDEFFPTPNSEYALIVIYIVLCLIYMAIGMNTMGFFKMLLKCSPVVFLIAFFIYIVTSLGVNPSRGVVNVENLERVIFGLMFSCLGDAYLVYDSFFIHGLLAFACAHLIYIGIFGGALLLFITPSYNELVIAAAVTLVSTFTYLYVLPELRKQSVILVVAAAVYCLLISLMLWCALVTMHQDTKLSTVQGAVGAGFFYISDLLLSVNRWGLKIPLGPHLVIGSYYFAQILIFFSVLNEF